jgi:hypothetical protein
MNEYLIKSKLNNVSKSEYCESFFDDIISYKINENKCANNNITTE